MNQILVSSTVLLALFFVYSSADLDPNAVVAALNKVRSNPDPAPAKALKTLTWSAKLAAYAAINVNSCNYTTVNKKALYRTQTNALRSKDFDDVIKLWGYERNLLKWNVRYLSKATNYSTLR